MKRCKWCCDDGLLQAYHDAEWGIPLHDDTMLFEFLSLEVMQCGLNWMMMLKKRAIFRQCFADFDFEKIASFDETDVQRIMEIPGMIRSERKIKAIIHNAVRYREIRTEFGSFDAYLWRFTDGEVYCYPRHQQGEWVAKNALSDRISADLKKRGFKFVGSVTVYSFLQACGMINDHEPECFLYERMLNNEKLRYIEDEI